MKKLTAIAASVLLLALVPSTAAQAGMSGNPYERPQCTWYAWGRRPDLPPLGHALNWDENARAAGFQVVNYPAEGAVVVFEACTQGADWGNPACQNRPSGRPLRGHVAYVEEVLDATTFRISETNFVGDPYAVNLRIVHTGPGVSFILPKPVPPTSTYTPIPTATATPISSLPGRIMYAVKVPDSDPNRYEIHLMSASGTGNRVLINDSADPDLGVTDLSPDGTKLVYSRIGPWGGLGEIWVYDLISDSTQLLVPLERIGFGMYPESYYAYWNLRWSPDDRSVYYIRGHGFAPDVDSLWRVDLANPASRMRVSDLGTRVSSFSGDYDVSPTTGQFMFTNIDPAVGHIEFFLADENGRGREPVPTQTYPRPYPVSFAPDGSAFAFTARTGDLTNIFVKMLGEPGEKQITQGHHYVGVPSWSPDGEWLVFERYITDKSDLWAVSLIDGSLVQITYTPGISELAPIWGH